MEESSRKRHHKAPPCPKPEKRHQKESVDGFRWLRKDGKTICRVELTDQSVATAQNWDVTKFVKEEQVPSGLHHCTRIHPDYENSRQSFEWQRFLCFLKETKKAAFATTEDCEMYILPPLREREFSYALVECITREYRVSRSTSYDQSDHHKLVKSKVRTSSTSVSGAKETRCRSVSSTKAQTRKKEEETEFTERCTRMAECYTGLESRVENTNISVYHPKGKTDTIKNYVSIHPSFLKALGQTHSDWIFGAIAEFVDNSRDANASTLDISVDTIYSSIAGKDIPMLAVIDDGYGMDHHDIMRMVAFGRKQNVKDNPDYIGRYGIGFKTATMRLGNDALVLTQTANSRSIAFLSQSFNEGKDNLEIPIVTYSRIGQHMQLDTTIQDEASAKSNLKAITKFSPFDKYFIGEKAGLFERNGTGTQIYVWNLDEWGSQYSVEWVNGLKGGSSFHHGDIYIRSRRARSRVGQMTSEVPLDFSLRSYLEVIFLDPRMKIKVQGSLVKSRPLARFLHRTSIEEGFVMEKPVQLFLGHSQLDWEQKTCGIFLYWHGRLIEAYKRVGSMIYNGETSHGIVGVIDVTNVMDDASGRVWVHNNKQGFVECEPYARLVDWLSKKVDEYVDNNVDRVYVTNGGPRYKPDHEWVQCDKCRKWRMLDHAYGSRSLPQEWFCYMKPVNGKCEIPEQKLEPGVITVLSQRGGYNCEDNNIEEANRGPRKREHKKPPVQVVRRGPTRQCRLNN